MKNKVFKSLEDIYLEDIRKNPESVNTVEVYPIDDLNGFETDDEYEMDSTSEIYSQDNEPESSNINLRPDGEEIVNRHLSNLATELVEHGICSPDEVEAIARDSYDSFLKILKWKQE
jgi:hypothetical protein